MDRDAAVAAYCASHGGVHQRTAAANAAAAAAAASAPSSPIADLLEEMFAWGDLKATAVSRIARAGVEEIEARGLVAGHDLRKLAAGGKGHERQSMLRAVAPSPDVPKPARIRVPCVPLRSNNVTVAFVWTQVYLVNEVLECLYQYFPNRFADLLGSGLRQFWSQVKPTDPRLVGHPMLSRTSWMDRAIPFVMHGDGVAFTMQGNSLPACRSAVC